MNDMIEIVASLVESYIVVRLCNRFLGFRNQNFMVLKSIIFYIILVAENIWSTWEKWQHGGTVLMEGMANILFVLLTGTYVFLFLKGTVYEKILITFLPSITIVPINLIVLNMIRTLFGEASAELIEPGGRARIYVIIFSKLAFFLVCEFIIHMRKRGKYSLSGFQWGIQLSCFLITFLIAYLQLKMTMKNDNMPEFLPVSMLIAVLNVLLYILLNRMQRDNIIKEEYRIAEISLSAQEKLIEEAREQYSEMRTLRHDMRHYLTTAAELISAGKVKEAGDYIGQIIEAKVNTTAVGVDTGNAVIDAVLNNRIAVCRKKGIEMKCLIDSGFQGIDDMDISILLSNVLDNAVRGCTGVDSAEIELVIGTRKTLIYIIVKNSIPTSVLSRNPQLETDKENKSAHGFGIMSVRKIAEKYGGSVECREEGESFITEIWLQRREQSDL